MPEALKAGDHFAGYRLEELIGQGGMGVVYRASDPSNGRAVALKVIAGDAAGDVRSRRRFERETRLASALGHPNVVPVIDAGESAGQLYLAMEYVEGIDLRALLLSEGDLAPRHVARLVAGIASGLDAAHEQGLVHRDVKPGNVLLAIRDGELRIFLADFGLSKRTDSQSGLTRPGAWVGTMDYSAPEQMQAADTDARTDVYALGCVTFEMLVGEVPFPRARPVQKIVAHVTERPPRVADVHFDIPGAEEISLIVDRALAKHPEERYQSAGEFARAFTVAAELAPEPGSTLVEIVTRRVNRPAPAGDRGAPTA